LTCPRDTLDTLDTLDNLDHLDDLDHTKPPTMADAHAPEISGATCVSLPFSGNRG
jgi:hypothetical protein